MATARQASLADAQGADPLAALRNLRFTHNAATEDLWLDGSGTESGGPVFQQGAAANWSTDFDALPKAFQSKYNKIRTLPDGRIAITVQQPGGHKYDTMEVIYAQGGDGQWQMQGSNATRQKGSGLSAKVEDELLGLGVNERIAAGLSGGPGSSVALAVDDVVRGIRSAGVGGAVGRMNDEVGRNSNADIYDNARAASRAAVVAGAAGGGAALAGAAGGGAAGGAASGAVFGGASQAQGSGKDIIKGAATGAALGGLRGAMSGPSASGEYVDGNVSGMDLAADGGANSYMAGDAGVGAYGAGSGYGQDTLTNTGSAGGSLGDASFKPPANSFNLDPNGIGGGAQFGASDIPSNTLELNQSNGTFSDATLPRSFSGAEYTSSDIPSSQYTANNRLPGGSYNELGADGTSQVVNTNSYAPQSSPGSNTLGDFFSGNGKTSDYIQLGGLVASVASRPRAPDTSGINDAARSSAAISERQQDLAEKQYADQMALLNEYKPMLQRQLQNSIDEQAKSSGRSDQQWDDYMKTWRPVEQTLADKSLNWASDGRMQQAAQEAQSGVATQYDTARQQSREQMIAAGLDPSTIAAIQASTGALEAKDRAGAANTARRTVESQGMAYLDNAARFGRNMPSTGLAAAGLAGAQGQQAQSGYSGLVNATAAPLQASTPLFSSAMSGNNSAGSLYGNAAQLNNQSALQNYNATMGTIAGLNQWYQSSKKTKNVHGKVKGAANAVEKSGASKWSYKPGLGDGNTKMRMGPMAEDLQREAPSVSNGKVVDTISLAGLHHAAIGENTRKGREQDKRIARLERKLSLADA